MSDTVDHLRTALDRRDRRRASAALAGLQSDGRTDDDALDLLAARAGADELAAELLLAAIDDTGLARAGVERVLVDESAVEDVTQDVLIAVARHVGRFRGDAKFKSWLFQVARNQAIDHLRRQRATVPLDEHDISESQRMSSIIAGQESARQLVDRLPETYRETVARRDLERATYAEIAEALDLNLNTVKTRVARGRAMLAGQLSPDVFDPGP